MAIRTSQIVVERLVFFPKEGLISTSGSTAMTTFSGSWVGGSLITPGGATAVQINGQRIGLDPHLRLYQSVLGSTQPLNEAPRQYRLAQLLGRYPLAGGHLPVLSGKYGILFITGVTQLAIRPEVNGRIDPLTSKLALPWSKFRQFSLGIGGVVRPTSTLATTEFDGDGTMAISGLKITYGSPDWAHQSLNLTGGYIALRNRTTEYAHTVNWMRPFPLTQKAGTNKAFSNQFAVTEFFRQGRFILPGPAQFTEEVFFNTASAWSAMSSFSGTLATKNFHQSTMASYTFHKDAIVERLQGFVPTLEADGQTSLLIGPSFRAAASLEKDGITTISIIGSQSMAGAFEGDGSAAVQFSGDKFQNGGFEGDGSVDIAIDSTIIPGGGFNGDGYTDVVFHVEGGTQEGGFEGDGAIDVEFTATHVFQGQLPITTPTDVAITATQTYSNNTFTMDGTANEFPTAAQVYGDNLFQWPGSTDVEWPNVQKLSLGPWQADGQANVTCDGIADYFIRLTMDGVTSVDTETRLSANAQLLSTGVGDCFMLPYLQQQAYLNMDGATNVAFTANVRFEGLWQQYTGIGTSVAISGARLVLAYVNADGSVSFSTATGQDQFADVIFDQISETLSAVGSFVYPDGAVAPLGSSSFSANPTQIVLGSAWVPAVIDDVTHRESDFTPMFTGSFTASSQTSRATGTSYIGRYLYKTGFGYSRPIATLATQVHAADLTRAEWVKIALFVDESLDIVQDSETISMTVSGSDPASAGHGYLGHIKEEYATLAKLTNARNTQVTLESLVAGNPHVDVTQVCYEMLWIKTAAAQNTQTVAEVLYLANLGAIQQIGIEALAAGNGGNLGVNQSTVEALFSIKARTMATQVAGEYLKGPGNPNVHATQAAVEILTLNDLHEYSILLDQQVAVESVHNGSPNLAANAATVETIHNSERRAIVNSDAVELLHNNIPNAVINAESIEFVKGIGDRNLQVQSIAIEFLVRAEYDPEASGLVNNPRYVI